ncbi:amino acid adenylation domain-containing protein [Nocardia sp. NPDC051570]|uniref:amino acid adenylation domain-containing protein n=1 Tax=Nocardia sp. NPDC051570 TaxID=3364324 RepID=UPI0037AAB669
MTEDVFDRVKRYAVGRPDRHAFVSGGSAVTYSRLAACIEQTSAALRTSGCAAGDIVACMGYRGVDSAVLFLAIESIGAVYLPVDPRWPPARVAEVIEGSGSALLVDYTVEGSPKIEVRQGVRERRRPPWDNRPRYVIYTSGTTGRPKGAIVAREGMLNHLWAKITDLAITAEDRVAFTAPLVFDISIWQMLAPLMVGATVVVVSDNDVFFPRRLCGVLARREVSIVELVPTAMGMLLDEVVHRATARPLPALRWLISTGEELKPALAERALATVPHVGLLNAYGPTECSDDVTHHVVRAVDTADSRLPIGRPIANVTIYCLEYSPEEGLWHPAETGAIGEIFVGGISVGLGYLGNPDANRAAFFRDTFDPDSPTGRLYRTGDLGIIEDGILRYVGRTDRQVKVSGIRMELDEIEAALSRHSAISGCAVTLSDRVGPSRYLIAHYVPNTSVTAEQLKEYLQLTLPSNLVPQQWHEIEEMPVTFNGKIDYRELERREGSR